MNLLSSVEGVTLTWNDLSIYAKHKQKYFFSTKDHRTKIIKNGEFWGINVYAAVIVY